MTNLDTLGSEIRSYLSDYELASDLFDQYEEEVQERIMFHINSADRLEWKVGELNLKLGCYEYANNKSTSLEDEMKEEWFEEVSKKYTLAQLESVLGTKDNLKEFNTLARKDEIEMLENTIWLLESRIYNLQEQITDWD
jgi:hypothetical protein